MAVAHGGDAEVGSDEHYIGNVASEVYHIVVPVSECPPSECLVDGSSKAELIVLCAVSIVHEAPVFGHSEIFIRYVRVRRKSYYP